MKKFGKDLHFISWIKRDGSGTEKVKQSTIYSMDDELFRLNWLSITSKTFIASGFNSYVVKLKSK